MTSLEYAAKSQIPWRHRRAVKRVFVSVAILAVVVIARYATPPIWKIARAYLVFKRSLSFTAYPDQVAFDADPIRAASLLAADSQYWNQLNHKTPGNPVASWAPRQWVALVGQLDSTLMTYRLSPPLIFMHERKSADGSRRLVILRYAGTADAEAGPATHAFECDLIDPKRRPGPANVSTSVIKLLLMKHPMIRIYFGQVDAEDASAFSVRYETEDGGGAIDGRLMDGASVRLEVRDGPEKLVE